MDYLKKCKKCKEEKPLSDYGADKYTYDGLRCYCKECAREITRKSHRKNSDKRKQYLKEYTEKNAEKMRKWANSYRKGRREKIKKYYVHLLGGECQVCGYSKCIAALDFHHLDPTVKELSIGYHLSKASKKAFIEIREELKKCILLCCRCHREYHNGHLELGENIKPPLAGEEIMPEEVLLPL